MEPQDFFHLFAYNAWANRESLASLSACATPPRRALQVMAHIVGAERLWHARLRRVPPPLAVWPELTPAECERHLPELAELWRRYLGELDRTRLDDAIPYTNTKGEHYASRIGDVLMHVIVHSAYHRGQIASELRAHGATPAYTDLIHAVRQGLIPQGRKAGEGEG